MRHISAIFLLIIAILLCSCDSQPIEPFELSVADYDYSRAYSILYKVSNQKLTVLFRGELENEKDSILYTKTNLPVKEIRKLSGINLDSLGVFYSNPCIADGDIKVYKFTKNGKTKQIQVQNYYHQELDLAIEVINDLVPEELQMYHNKEGLISSLKRCGQSQIRMSWNDD
ncbi:hypothetical protein [Aureitalea marina]|uniref:Uncharacterized protein n=1 Tax=Aureitalea marina TaxID=930804 RepID=A0A2S7KT17_9FLAO|nr:hypothetical protein [Aureitalea marina]PQB05771.1 hypothetical protein BST85_13360 [Aureitalea marina]